MNRTGFLVLASSALLLAFALAVGLGSFVYSSAIADRSDALMPHLLLAGATFILLGSLIIILAGFVTLGRRQLPALETIAWVLLMLVFPVIGSGAFLLVSPARRHTAPSRV